MEIDKVRLYDPSIPVCQKCDQKQWSIMDRKYLEINGHCWSCDKRDWEAGFLSLEEFEKREKQALNLSVN